MKKLKIQLAGLAMILAVGSVYASTAKVFANKKWGRDPVTGIYSTDVTGQTEGIGYDCDAGSGICTAEFPPDVDPRDQAHDAHPGTVLPTNTLSGVFN